MPARRPRRRPRLDAASCSRDGRLGARAATTASSSTCCAAARASSTSCRSPAWSPNSRTTICAQSAARDVGEGDPHGVTDESPVARDRAPAPEHRVPRRRSGSRTPASEVFATLLDPLRPARGATSRSSSRSPGTSSAASRPRRSGPTSTCPSAASHRADRARTSAWSRKKNQKVRAFRALYPEVVARRRLPARLRRAARAPRPRRARAPSRPSIAPVSDRRPYPLRRSRRPRGQDRPLRRVGDAAARTRPGTLAEHLACRRGAVVFDVSHLGHGARRRPGMLRRAPVAP